MPQVYVAKESYDQIVRRGLDVQEFVDAAVKAALREVKR